MKKGALVHNPVERIRLLMNLSITGKANSLHLSLGLERDEILKYT